MNTKTFLSKSPNLFKRWQGYKKPLNPIPPGWLVSSDYCLDDLAKNDCITFTISPVPELSKFAAFLNKKLPKDIKNMSKVPDEVIKFIRDNKIFFTISFIIKNKEKFIDIDEFKADIENIRTGPHIRPHELKALNKFSAYLKKTNINHNVLRNMQLVVSLFPRIVEFLTMKHFTEAIYWAPDRDAIMDISDGIISKLINIQCTNLLHGRRKVPELHIGIEDKKEGVFRFDTFIRYPDIITGVVSSVDFNTYTAQKEKHFDLLVNAVLGNPRIVIIEMERLGEEMHIKVLPLHRRMKSKDIVRASDGPNV